MTLTTKSYDQTRPRGHTLSTCTVLSCYSLDCYLSWQQPNQPIIVYVFFSSISAQVSPVSHIVSNNSSRASCLSFFASLPASPILSSSLASCPWALILSMMRLSRWGVGSCGVWLKDPTNNLPSRPCHSSHSMPIVLILPKGGCVRVCVRVFVCVCACFFRHHFYHIFVSFAASDKA